MNDTDAKIWQAAKISELESELECVKQKLKEAESEKAVGWKETVGLKKALREAKDQLEISRLHSNPRLANVAIMQALQIIEDALE